jgi:uncharacterized RDD family membrane protein YckC
MQKAKNSDRVLAFVVDLLIAMGLGSIPFLGGLFSFIYLLLRDGISRGEGVGKRLMKLKVVRFESNAPIDYADSAKRNLIFALPAIALIIPFLGWALYLLFSVIVWTVEIIAFLRDPQGRRIGDKWAGTWVVAERTIVE